VSGPRHLARDFGQTLDIGSALKKSRPRLMAIEDFEKFRGRLARSIVERQRYGATAGIAAPDRGTEHFRSASTYGPRHEARGNTSAEYSQEHCEGYYSRSGVDFGFMQPK